MFHIVFNNERNIRNTNWVNNKNFKNINWVGKEIWWKECLMTNNKDRKYSKHDCSGV